MRDGALRRSVGLRQIGGKMDDAALKPAGRPSVPAWYWLVAIAALLFEASGAYLFATSLSLDPETLPLDQRALIEATPQWMTICWGLAIGLGLAGALGLLMRRRFAEPLLLGSLLAVLLQFAGILFVRELRELTPESHLAVPIVVTLFAYGFWQTAKLARARGWLA